MLKIFDTPTSLVRRFYSFMEQNSGKKGWVALQMLLDAYDKEDRLSDLEERVTMLEEAFEMLPEEPEQQEESLPVTFGKKDG